jgi:outer membrane lipoprotein SlyB
VPYEPEILMHPASMPTVTAAPRLHPLVATAAVAVTAASVLAAVALVKSDVAARHMAAAETQIAQTAADPTTETPAIPLPQAGNAADATAPNAVPAPIPRATAARRAPARPAPIAQAAPEPQPLPPIDAAPRGAERVYTPAPVALCTDCGVVSAVREVKTPGQAQGLGAVAGGVVGAVIGNQIGKGNGRDAARIVGILGGAVAGHQIEKHARSEVRYEIDVRMEDGSLRTVAQAQAPELRAGDAVRLDGNGLRMADGRAVPTRVAPRPAYGTDPAGGA